MKHRTVGKGGLALLALALVLALSPAVAMAVQSVISWTTTRVSTKADGSQLPWSSFYPNISGSGRYVTFETYSAISEADTNFGVSDIYLRDMVTGGIELVSVNTSGVVGNDYSWSSSVSSNGRFVVFTSAATNLAGIKAQGGNAIYLRDRLNGTTSMVADLSDQQNFYNVVTLTDDGNTIAFATCDALVESDTNGDNDIYLYSVSSDSYTLVSSASGGGSANDDSFYANISPDGRFVTFTSDASNLVEGDGNYTTDVFLWDRSTDETTRESVSDDEQQSDGCSCWSSVSDDGQYLAFASYARNLEADADTYSPTPGTYDIYLRDRAAGTTTRVSGRTDGSRSSGSWYSSISGNGRYVAFISDDASQTPQTITEYSDETWDAFRWDRTTGQAVCLSVAGTENGSGVTGSSESSATGNGNSYWAMISDDGGEVALASEASNLITTADTNYSSDVFYLSNFSDIEDEVLQTGTNDTLWGAAFAILVLGALSLGAASIKRER